jgi:hypothetical protein
MVLCAALLVAAAALSALTVDNNVLRPAGHHQVPEPECRTCCLVGAPPLEPGSSTVPVPVASPPAAPADRG